MDWFGGRVSLGSLDLAGAVNKLQESVKNIEKNFDTALGLEENKPESSNEASASWSSTNTKTLFDPVMSFMGHKGEEDAAEKEEGKSNQDEAGSVVSNDELPEQTKTTQDLPSLEGQRSDDINEAVNPSDEPASLPDGSVQLKEQNVHFGSPEGSVEQKEQNVHVGSGAEEEASAVAEDSGESRLDAQEPTASPQSSVQDVGPIESNKDIDEEDKSEAVPSEQSELAESQVLSDKVDEHDQNALARESSDAAGMQEAMKEPDVDSSSPVHKEVSSDSHAGDQIENSEATVATEPTNVTEPRSPVTAADKGSPVDLPSDDKPETVAEQDSEESNTKAESIEVSKTSISEVDAKELSPASTMSDSSDAVIELEKLKREMKMMETALQGAARQAQAKADEIAKLMSENEHLKSVLEEVRRKSSDADVESLREEYHQRVATLERKVYALTKERDTLRREQNKRSDAAALLKEKDEIITQVMAEGEQLSKKQAAQEATIRKLRAQIRELEEEKKAFITKLQLEESKVESIKKDKAATEQLLQETIERHQTELAGHKEYYTKALNAAKEAEALAEARANSEARAQLEGRLREAEEREAMLVQALEELRHTLSRQEQEAIAKEDRLHREIEDLQKRYQASERRCEELVTQVPESTRPLLRQIEAMQEASALKAEAWAAVERTLQSRLQEAEAKAAAAEERERSINERLSQTLSRINVLEAQISCLRAEQTQLNRSLEKERQRAAENRQEYLAAKEEADTHEARVNQLEEEIKEFKRKHKNELQESLAHRELMQQELEREKAARHELEKKVHMQSSAAPDQSPTIMNKSTPENGNLTRKLSSASSLGNMEESFFLQASLDSSGNFLERRNSGESTMSSYYLKSMTPSGFEAALRQKEGELASYMSRLASMESIRDSLAEELVKMTEQCEKLRTEAATLRGIRAELEALRQRHTAALELMGERDEELEELRNDIVDLKEMYKEQVNLLVNKIQMLSSQIGAA